MKCIKIDYRMIPGQSSANFFNKSALISVAITFAPSLAKAWNTQLTNVVFSSIIQMQDYNYMYYVHVNKLTLICDSF